MDKSKLIALVLAIALLLSISVIATTDDGGTDVDDPDGDGEEPLERREWFCSACCHLMQKDCNEASPGTCEGFVWYVDCYHVCVGGTHMGCGDEALEQANGVPSGPID